MVSANILVEARRRAGLSQRALAERAGVGQKDIARYERAHVVPSLERLQGLVRACDLELTFGLARADDSYDADIAAALAVAPATRLERARDESSRMHHMRQHHQRMMPDDQQPRPHGDILKALRALDAANVHYVLIGEYAETLRGSPLVSIDPDVRIVARVGESAALRRAIAIGEGTTQRTPGPAVLDQELHVWLHTAAIELVAVPVPAGTSGYADLARDATELTVVEGEDELVVSVASLIDLVRMAEASTDSHDRARIPALRRTLQLADGADEREERRHAA